MGETGVSSKSFKRGKELIYVMRDGFTNFRRDLSQMRGTNVWTFIMYGLLFDVSNNLWRPFSIKFLERLGGTEFELSLLSALPGLVGAIVLLPGAILFRRFTNRKRATAAFILVSRAMLLGIAFVPMLPPVVRPMLFVVLVAIMNCPDALSQNSLQSFLGTVFNGSLRGQAIALRTKFGQALIPVVTISTGLAITLIPSTDEQRMILYQIFFVVAFLFGVVEVVIFNRLQVPITPPQQELPKVKTDIAAIKTICKDKKFMAFLVPAITFAFTWQAGWPLANIYHVRVINATELWLAIFALVSGLTAFFSGTFWQRLLRKRGNNAVFVVAAALLAGNMFVFPFVPNVFVMTFVSIFTGFSAVGINTALLNGALEATPDENRLMYLAFYNTTMNISLFVAPLFAWAILARVGITYALIISGVMRVGGTLYIWLGNKYKKQSSF